MTIKEQIEIARLIASGTPREVAILESSAIEKSGPTIDVDAQEVKTPQQKSVERQKMLKAKQKETKNKLANIKKQTKDLKADKKIEDLRRKSQVIRGNVADRISKAKFSSVNTQTVTQDEGGATAAGKAVGNVAKTGVAATKNVAKGIGKAVVGVRNLNRARKDRSLNKKLYRLEMDKIREKQYLKKLKKMKEEFIQEVEDKKDSKAKKVIDIMKGKNPVKINPDVKEDTVVVQDASGKDFVEIVDIITPEKIRSDWRKEINVTEASAAWTRKEGKKKSGGLNEKGRKSYERQNPGSDLKAPSKKVGNPRRKSFCARMKGMKKKLTSAKTARDPNSRINKSLRAWNC